MGQNLQGATFLVTGHKTRTLGMKAEGRTVTSFVPLENYLRAIGQRLYDRIDGYEHATILELWENTA